MRVVALVCAVLAASGCVQPVPGSPSAGPWRFAGSVWALEGAASAGPVTGAELTVIHGVNKDATVRTDEAGHYEFLALESGRFTLAIAARGYVTVTPVVELYRDTEANFALSRE
jgi:hypothetical protein